MNIRIEVIILFCTYMLCWTLFSCSGKEIPPFFGVMFVLLAAAVTLNPVKKDPPKE